MYPGLRCNWRCLVRSRSNTYTTTAATATTSTITAISLSSEVAVEVTARSRVTDAQRIADLLPRPVMLQRHLHEHHHRPTLGLGGKLTLHPLLLGLLQQLIGRTHERP